MINVNQSSCEIHKRYYDKEVRQSVTDKKYFDYYNSPRYKALRARAVSRDFGLCVKCRSENKITVYQDVHHIEPIKTVSGWAKRWELNGLQCLCETHHKQADNKIKNKRAKTDITDKKKNYKMYNRKY